MIQEQEIDGIEVGQRRTVACCNSSTCAAEKRECRQEAQGYKAMAERIGLEVCPTGYLL
jgi:hypothetical protein